VAMPVFSVVPRPPGLEEVYFALTGRPAAVGPVAPGWHADVAGAVGVG